MRNIIWHKGSAFNHGKIEGTDYRCKRFRTDNEDGKRHWFLLADSKKTYLCCKGPFFTPEERDKEIIREVCSRDSNR